MSNSTKKLALTAMGIALFVVFSLMLQVPVFENYYLCLGYAVMAVFCYCFGTWYGISVGFFGVILYCLVINGLRGMPGWALGNIVIAFLMGTGFRKAKSITCCLSMFPSTPSPRECSRFLRKCHILSKDPMYH